MEKQQAEQERQRADAAEVEIARLRALLAGKKQSLSEADMDWSICELRRTFLHRRRLAGIVRQQHRGVPGRNGEIRIGVDRAATTRP